jgi:hypothetical protein
LFLDLSPGFTRGDLRATINNEGYGNGQRSNQRFGRAGDKKLETEGKTEKAAGKVQNAVGGLKDAVRGED